jgi:hypothetical protein
MGASRVVRCKVCGAPKELQHAFDYRRGVGFVPTLVRVCVNAACPTRQNGGAGDPRPARR